MRALPGRPSTIMRAAERAQVMTRGSLQTQPGTYTRRVGGPLIIHPHNAGSSAAASTAARLGQPLTSLDLQMVQMQHPKAWPLIRAEMFLWWATRHPGG